VRPSGGMNDEDCEEIIDGDEGIINRRLPMNSYNHQIQGCIQYPIGMERFLLNKRMPEEDLINEEEEGWENCREEDEERKEGDIMDQSLRRQVLKENSGANVLQMGSDMFNVNSSINGEKASVIGEIDQSQIHSSMSS
jgi:hypothetical protein